MKLKLSYIFCAIFACALCFNAEAQTTYYVLNQSTEKSGRGDLETYELSGPGATLTFDAKRNNGASYPTLTISYSTDGSSFTQLAQTWSNGGNGGLGSLGSSYSGHTLSLNTSVKKIRFNISGGLYTGQVKNVKVTRATTLSANSSSLAFGNVKYGESGQKSINVTYNNTYSGAVLTGTCDNPAFTVTRTEMGETGTKGITITYNAKALGQQTGTVTLTMGTDGKNNTVTTTFTVSGTGVIDYDYEATTGVNHNTFGSASVAFDGGTAGITANTSVQNTTESSVNKTAVFSATAKPGYEFVGWGTSADATSYESAANPYNYSMTATLSAPSQSKTLYAIFKPVFIFSASATSSNVTLGTTTATVGNTKILGDVDDTQAQTTATFTATPANDCIFKGWYEASDYSGEPVSTNATYNVTLTNTTIGSTASKALYALFKKKQNLQWKDPYLDLNLVNGQVYPDGGAKVTSGKTISYTTDNAQAVTIDADGTIHAVGLGDAHVTASVEDDDIYQSETITRDFSVGEIKQATFTPAWGDGNSTDIKVDGSTSIALTNIANDASFTVSATPEGIISWTRNGNTLEISAVKAGTATLTLSQKGSAVLAGNQVAYTITVSKYPNSFALSSQTKAMKVGEVWENVVTSEGNGNTQVSYSSEGIATYDADANRITADAEGSTAITFTQEATASNEGTSKTVNITVTRIANSLSITLGSTEVNVGDQINLMVSGNDSKAAIIGHISDVTLSSDVNNGDDVITYADGVITARNAGTARIRFTQDATDRYTAYESETYAISVNKLSNSITVTLDGEQKNSKNVGHGVTVPMSLTSTSGSDSFSFNRISGTDAIATINSNSIVSGTTDGTSIWEISQAETYRYSAANTMVRIKVNSVAEEEGYVLEDLSEHEWGTISSYTPIRLSGPGETLSFEASKSWGGANYFFVLYSTDGGNNWTTKANPDLSSSWNAFSYEIPESATHVKFESRTGATLSKYVRNIRVTRKTYVSATATQTNLGEVYTDKTASASFNVNYSSTNGGDIEIISNNPRFTVDSHTIPVNAHSDNVSAPAVVNVIYTPDPDRLGNDEGTITISDRYYSAELTFTATARKYETSIGRGSNTATETVVDGTIDNAFAFTGTSAPVPSADIEDSFYYVISSTYASDIHTDEDVISYNPATNTITGRNSGSAKLTIYQKSTGTYSAASRTFDFTVSKLDNPVNMSLGAESVEVDGEISLDITDDDAKGEFNVEFSNVSYVNPSQNREGGFMTYDRENRTLKGMNAGSATVTVTQAETYKYLAKSRQFSVAVNKLEQTLVWDREVETSLQIDAVVENNTAHSQQELTPVTYASGNTAAIEVDAQSGRIVAKAVGSNITITASQAGNYKYAAANITRQFSVFNKQTPAFTPEEGKYDSVTGTITLCWEGTATIAISGVGADAGSGFTITNGDDTVIGVERGGEDDSVITITGLKIGSTTLTLAQAANADFIGKTATYTVNVVMPADYLTLDPSAGFALAQGGEYHKIFLNRSIPAGLNTIALPFSITAAALGASKAYSFANVGVADGAYYFYFKEISADETLVAGKPYIILCDSGISNVERSGSFDVLSAEQLKSAGTVSCGQWNFVANFSAGSDGSGIDMNGKYGVVNSEGRNMIMLGGPGSALQAFTAYFEIAGSRPSAMSVTKASVQETSADMLVLTLPLK